MPDFIAGSLSATAFCLCLATLNALTRFAAPPDLMEGSFVQYGAALIFARLTWKSARRPRLATVYAQSGPKIIGSNLHPHP